MTGADRRTRAGVTPAMIETYGDMIFDLSHNLQIRRGDTVRLLDFDGYEKNRDGAGLSDEEISERLGLTREQVIVIRNAAERARIRTETYYRLNTLGGGRRFRADEGREPESGNRLVREALTFDPDRVRHFLEQGYWKNDTLTGWLERNAETRPDHPALVMGDTSLTYRELAARVRELSGNLRGLGLGPGDVVAVQLPNNIEYVLAYLAIGAIRGIMTTVYMPHRETEIETLLAHSQARAFVCLPAIGEFRPAATALKLAGKKLPQLDHVITVGGEEKGAVPFQSLEVPLKGRQPAYAPPAGADPFLLLYTSGTTAQPKGVPLTYQNMLGNARLGAPEHQLTGEDRIMSAAPFGHLYGLYSMHLALAVGATIVLLPEFSPPALIQTIEGLKPTAIYGGPAHVAACMGAGVLDKADLSSVKLFVLSGAQVPEEIVTSFAPLLPNGHVSQLWGMTETQAGTYTRPGAPVARVAEGAGPPSPGTEIRVVDEGGKVLPAGKEGELQVRGPSLFAGYLDNPAANADAFSKDGWFQTGDLAIIDKDGWLRMTGRKKDVINRGGVKYNPRDIENLLDAHPAIAQSAIVPYADEVLGERACAFIVPASDKAPSLADLCTYLMDKGIAKTKLPEKLEVIDAMPMTATRKIIKGKLKPSD